MNPGTTRFVTLSGTLTEARARRRSLMAAGRPAAPVATTPTVVRGFAEEWFGFGAKRWAPATIASRDLAYRTRIDPSFGHRRLADLTRDQIQAWALDLLAADHGHRSVQIAVETLRTMLNVAIRRGLLAVNPVVAIELPVTKVRERSQADRVLNPRQVGLLIDACRGLRQETLIRAAVEGGLRRGEIAGLTWPDVRLEERRLAIRQQVYQDSRVGKIVKRMKKGDVDRIAISPTFALRLADWYAEAVVLGGGDATSWVWPGRHEPEPMSPSSVSHLVAKIGKRADLVDHLGRHIAHLHGLRHSAGSIALANGVPLTVVSAQLRHSRLDTTTRTYLHLLGDEQLDRFAAAHEPAGSTATAQTMPETMPEKRIPQGSPAKRQ